MCAPSTSASVIITMLWYLILVTSKSFPMPPPIAMARFLISSWSRSLSGLAFSTLRIFPLSGRMAWNARSLPCLALPPAESPSTMYSSHLAGSFSEQSASFPGRLVLSRTLFLRVASLAFLAASLPS